MEQFHGMFGLPRHITWPVGFAVFLFVMALVSTVFRKRSQTWAATAVQSWLGFIVMAAIAAVIYLMLPSEFFDTAVKEAANLSSH